MTREQQILAVAQDAHDLQSLVTRMWAWRLNPATSDLVASEEGNLLAAFGSMRDLVMDIRDERDDADRRAA